MCSRGCQIFGRDSPTSQLNLFTSEDIPAWLPPQAKEARSHVFWAQIVAFIEIPLSVFITVLLLYYYFRYSATSYLLINPNASSLASAFFTFSMYFVAVVIISILELVFIKVHVSNPIDSGKFVVAEERAILWGVISLLFGLIPGIMLLAAGISLRDLNRHVTSVKEIPSDIRQQGRETARGSPTETKRSIEPPQSPPRPAQQYSVPPASRQHPDMYKCKKCGASFPAFMRSCPNCNELKT